MKSKTMSPRFRKIERVKTVNTAKRVFIVGAFLACSFGLLASRAIFFNLKNNDDVEKVAMRQYRTAVHQSTKRGKILDSSGRELAIDVAVESVYANPREIDTPVVMADKLSRLLKIDRPKILERLSSDRKFVWVKRKVTEDESKAIKAGAFKGIYTMRENGRSYPGKNLASGVLGAVGFDSAPLGGVELSYNEMLSLSHASGDTKRDARGHLYLSPVDDSVEDPKPTNVELTIDKTIQYIAERELVKGVEKAGAKNASAIVVDVNTGAILAMAITPSFDPNDYGKYEFSNWRNRAITDAYEPGSTFKSVIVAAALDRGIVTESDSFDCENGNMQIADHIVHDSHPHGKLTVTDIIKVSSNIGAYKIEQRMGRKNAYDAILSFGFGSSLGIDLPGESVGLMPHYGRWSELQFATIAFGQGLAVTPLQMAMAFAAIANGGTLYKPHVVKRVVKEDGSEIFSATPQIVSQPISKNAAKVMTRLLEGVTKTGGTGTMAASKEYSVAGKTGTAQKVSPGSRGYSAGKYYASFVGFAPSDNPRIAVYVGLDEPSGSLYYGGQVSAPIFREIVDSTLHYMKVPGNPVMTVSKDLADKDESGSTEELATLEIADGEIKEVVKSGEDSWRLPDLRGLTMRGVLESAKGADIAWRFKGSGIAVDQYPLPGSVIQAGRECVVDFKPLM